MALYGLTPSHDKCAEFGNIAKPYPIQYLQESDTFKVKLSDHVNIIGHKQVDHLYILEGNQPHKESPKPPSPQENIYEVQATSHVQTIEENAKILTPKEIVQANMAKQLLHMLGYPSVVNLKTIIKTNVIQESDVKLMEHLFRPDIPTIKGKTTRQCPHQLVSNMVSIPHKLHDAQCDVCLYIDIMYVNGMPFLTTISKNIKYCPTMWVADHTAPTITSLVLKRASFQVTEVCADHEFRPVLQVL